MNCRFYSFLIAGLLTSLVTAFSANNAAAQCATSGAPSYSSSCSNEYFTAMSASGTSVVSTISLSGGTCGGTQYFNLFTTQGVTVTAGNTVNLSITRFTTTYTGYLSVYVDWNNDGTYSLTELAGTMITEPASTLAVTYSFPVPTTGIVTGVNLHMRVFISELATGAPCTANFGQTYDYYLNASCPVTTITATPATASLCVGAAGVPLTAAGAGTGGTYTWTPAAGLSASTGASVTATPAATTTYTVVGTSSIGCSDSTTATITVNPAPSATVTASGPLSLCAGDNVTLSTTAATGDTYQWYNGTSPVSGATNATYTANAAGSYSLVVTNTSGCTATSTTFVVTLKPVVTITLTYTGDTTLCSGDSVKISVTNATGYTYQWMNGSTAVAGATNATYWARTSGSYTCVVTIPGSCASPIRSILVTVYPAPVPVITFNGKTFFTGTTFATYQWYENGGAITGATHDSVNAHSNGNYTVKVTDANGCTATSVVYNLLKLAVPNTTSAGEISIYPNPATSYINIVAPVTVNAIITDPSGKVAAQQKAAANMDISNLAAGVYLIQLFDQGGSKLLTQKIIKK